MANRITALKLSTFLSGGNLRVSKTGLAAFIEGPAKQRITKLSLQSFLSPPTNTQLSKFGVNVWTSLDQGLYLTLPPFGSNEVYNPSIESIFVPVSPPAPNIEVNPYRTDVPNVDQQRIMREQHNLVQAGDSTFHWGVLTEISAEPLYNLGSVGRFYHDEFGISIARYVKFTKMVETAAKAIPVGLNRKLNQPWTVTNQFELSDVNSVMGVACPYNVLIYSGSWYGWVIVDGFVPAEMDISLDNSAFEWGTEYGWSETGKVKPGVDGPSLGTRFTTTKVPNLKPGEFLVKVNPLSLARLAGLITAQLGPLTTQVAGLVTQVNALAATSTTHSTQIGQLQSQVVGLDNRITSESEAVARQLASIRALIPDVDYKSYVDGQVEMLTIRMDNQDSIIGEVANNALARVSELELKFDSLSTVALQNQIDALNDSMGGLTNRLVGFDTDIDTTTLTAGQVLISTDAGLTPGGTQLYTFQPIDFKFANLLDVDVTTPPTNGQVPIWDAGASKWIPGDQSGGGGGGAFAGARLDGSATSIPATTTTVISFSTQTFDTDAFSDPLDLSRLTIPAGVTKVVVDCGFQFNTAGGAKDIEFFLRRNGTTISMVRASVASWGGLNATSGVIEVAAGDYFEVAIWSSAAGGALRADRTWMTIQDVTGSSSGGGSGTGKPWYWNPPLAADFPTQFGDGAAVALADDADVGMVFDYGTTRTGDATRAWCKALPSGVDWEVTMRASGYAPGINYGGLGMILVNSTLSRAMINILESRGWYIGEFSLPTGFHADRFLRGFPLGTSNPFIRMSYVAATNVCTYSISADGKVFIDLLSYNSTWVGTPTHIGPGAFCNRSGLPQMRFSVDHWEQSW